MTSSLRVITRVVREVFDKKPTRLYVNKKRVLGYRGLKRKHESEKPTEEKGSCKEEWRNFILNTKEIASGTWNVVQTANTSVSFVRFDSVRYNNQLVVSETCFLKNPEEDHIETRIKYHEREVPREVVCTLESIIGGCALKERAVLWMKILETSFVCHGFTVNFEFADDRIIKHSIIAEDCGVSEERAFSNQCEILTNTAGVCCSKCSNEKLRLARRKLAKDKPPRWKSY